MYRGLCRVFRGASPCLKWKVGFNTEVAEGPERKGGHGAQHPLEKARDKAAPLQWIVELRLDRVCRHAYKHERVN